MNNPIVAWTNNQYIRLGDASHPEVPSIVQFNDGTYGNSVLADTDSAEIQLCVTNNFTLGTATADACFDMKNCTLTIKDINGGVDEQIVKQKWVRVKADSLSEVDFTQIGAHLDTDGVTYVEDSHPIGCGDSGVGVNNISGAANDGSATGTGKNNIAKFTLKAHPDTTADPIKHQFKLRTVYTYGTGV